MKAAKKVKNLEETALKQFTEKSEQKCENLVQQQTEYQSKF